MFMVIPLEIAELIWGMWPRQINSERTIEVSLLQSLQRPKLLRGVFLRHEWNGPNLKLKEMGLFWRHDIFNSRYRASTTTYHYNYKTDWYEFKINLRKCLDFKITDNPSPAMRNRIYLCMVVQKSCIGPCATLVPCCCRKNTLSTGTHFLVSF